MSARKCGTDYIANSTYTLDDARRMYANGESGYAIAKKVGVTRTTIMRIVDEKFKEKHNAYMKSYGRARTEMCRAVRNQMQEIVPAVQVPAGTVQIVRKSVLIAGNLADYELVNGDNVVVRAKIGGNMLKKNQLRELADELMAVANALAAC